MKNKFSDSEIIQYLPITTAFVIAVVTVFLFMQNSCFYFDDDISVFAPYGLKPYHGVFPVAFINRFFGYTIPSLFNLHPQDYITSVGAVISGILFASVPLFVSFIAFRKNKTHILLPFVFLFLFYYMFTRIFEFSICEFIIFEGFFRFLFPLVPYSVLLILIAKLYESGIFPSKHNIIFLSLLLLLVGMTGEIFALCAFITVVSILISIPFAFKKELGILSSNEKIKKTLILLIPFICLIIGGIILTINPGFSNHFHTKVDGFDIKNQWFSLDVFIDFAGDYIKYVILRHPGGLIAFVLFNILFLKLSAGKERRLIFIANTVTVSILLFNLSLYFMGKTQYFGGFWLHHSDIIFVTSWFIIISLMFFAGITVYIVSTYQNKRIKTILLCALLGLLSFGIIDKAELSIDGYAQISNKLMLMRRAVYIRDKFMLFYTYKNSRVHLPYSVYYINLWAIYNELPYSEYEKQVRLHECFYDDYYKSIYNVDKLDYIFTEDSQAFSEFYGAGGVLSDNELTELKFQKLFDKNFVLNNKKIPKGSK